MRDVLYYVERERQADKHMRRAFMKEEQQDELERSTQQTLKELGVYDRVG